MELEFAENILKDYVESTVGLQFTSSEEIDKQIVLLALDTVLQELHKDEQIFMSLFTEEGGLQKLVNEKPGYVIGCVAYTRNVSKLPDCNTCGRSKNCASLPKLGEYTRINCPLWVKQDATTKKE